MAASGYARAWIEQRVDHARTPRTTSRSSSRSHIRSWVAIWSLRERPARRRPPTSSPRPFDQPPLEGGVHVLVVLGGQERAGVDVVGEAAQPVEHRLELARR